MKNNKEAIKVIKDGQEVTANVINCFELDNGKTYVLYNFADDEEIYASTLVKTPEEWILDNVSDEDMEVIMQIINEANGEEV